MVTHDKLLAGALAFLGLGYGAMVAQAQSTATASEPPSGEDSRLELVASFDHEVTGVAVSAEGRIFVTFPRWTEDSPISVAELVKGELVPFPDERWNAWRNTRQGDSPQNYWICVQSLYADGKGNLWVLDSAAPAIDRVVPGGAKLVRIELSSKKVTQIIGFSEEVAPPSSYLNDVRVAADARHAYITDSGKGALVVVDLTSAGAKRVLDGHRTTQPEVPVIIKTDGKELRRPDGRAPRFGADGIALDATHLYWQALVGRTLYRLPLDALNSAVINDASLASRIERVGDNGVADGLWIDKAGRMYIGAIEENAIKLREGGKVRTLLRDQRLRWPDSFAEGPDGAIYVTTSRIMDNAQFRPDASPQLPTQLWRFKPEGRAPQDEIAKPNPAKP